MKKIFIILTIGILCACDNTPTGVISKGKMEDILFDFHIAQSMIYDLDPNEQEDKSQEYIDAVFRKYDVTQEQFDSSLVWYSRHTSEYHDIYKNIKDRYENLNSELQILNGNKDMMAVFSTGGDTTNIWGAQKLIVLRNNDLLNKESFTIKADTSFHKADSYILMCKANLILESKNERKEYISIGMSIKYKDGTTIGKVCQTSTTNESMQLTLHSNDSVEIEKITGFFYFNGSNTYRSTAFIDDIQLFRMHQHPKTEIQEQKPDTTVSIKEEPERAIVLDTIVHERITPSELLERNSKNEKTIKIKAAPDVRTPNTYGRRKKANPTIN